jgi:hypothetical protein
MKENPELEDLEAMIPDEEEMLQVIRNSLVQLNRFNSWMSCVVVVI